MELTASEYPELLDFQIQVLLNSRLGFTTIRELASLFDVQPERVGVTAYQACLDLDKLERRQRWRDPAEVVESPNVAALYHVCIARAGRVQGITRRRRLEGKLMKLERAYELARSRAWIEEFIGPPRTRSTGGAPC